MKSFFAVILVFFSFNSFAEELFETPFENLAYDARADISNKIQNCGLLITDPHDHRLPPPRIVADEAIVNRHLRVLAYYRSEYPWGVVRFVYSNPDGGMRHQIIFNRTNIEFVTPNQGIVARAMQQTNPGGYIRTFYCGNYRVSYEEFQQCITDRFTSFVSGQLCRYAE